MFALAIYDHRNQTLLLARDCFGIKPLFYAVASDGLMFASEIRALLDLPGIDDRPDRQAIYDFAALCYIPAPETFYAGIRALQPGEMIEARFDNHQVSWRARTYHQWAITTNPALTLSEATDRADVLVTDAVRRQMESDVPLGALLSGGIDSSLVSSAAQTTGEGAVRTFNVRFSDNLFDETWAAVAVANHIGSQHETLDMDDVRGNWEHVTGLLTHAGQPFADTSLFAVHAVCRRMRQLVTVALSGDGGDEGFGGYDMFWQISTIARLRHYPGSVWLAAATSLALATRFGVIPKHWPARLRLLALTDDTAVVQHLLCWLRDEEHNRLSAGKNLLPIRRLFEAQWEYQLPAGASQLERLSAHLTEINTRLLLPNDFLFKVDIASMKESLEIRVPMLDEELFSFGLSLPHCLKVKSRTCKRVLRSVAQRKLPAPIASKPKGGFGIPVDTWVDLDFKERLKDYLLGPTSGLPEFFRPEAYRPIIESFCNGMPCPGISRQGLYQRAIMFLALQLALDRAHRPAS
jgi:asparagine synthase (glutamine-hydrolysing)